MTTSSRLATLYTRMSEEQRKMILQAAEADITPSAGALRQIGSFERALSGIDAILDEQEPAPEPDRAPPVPRAAPPAPEPARVTAPDPVAAAPRLTGTVKWFSSLKGYGFIAPDAGGPDVFVHLSALSPSGFSDLHEGQRLAYALKADRKTGKSAAADLEPIA